MYSTDQPSPLREGDLYDVIVVGARAAGAATAMLLARRGVRTLLVDNSPLGVDTLSTHALMRAGVQQLARWQLLDAVIDAGTPPVRRNTFRYCDEDVVTSIKPSHGVDALYAPRRTILDPLLVSAAVEAGAHVHHRTSVRDVVISPKGRAVGVRATTSDRRLVAIGARLVIGADGVHSTIARLVGAPFTRVGEHVGAATYAYWSDLETDGYEWTFRPGACSGVIPTNNGEVCVFATGSPRQIGHGGIAVINENVDRGAPDLAARLRRATPPRGTRTWRGHHGYMRKAHGPGWALVGDAGYFKDPISAHGLTDALRDAEFLARAVVDGFGDRYSSADMHDALDEYERTRDRLSIPLFDVVDRLAGHDWDKTEIRRLLLELNSATTDEVETLAALDQEAMT